MNEKDVLEHLGAERCHYCGQISKCKILYNDKTGDIIEHAIFMAVLESLHVETEELYPLICNDCTIKYER